MINALHAEGLIESQFVTPRRINKLTDKGVEVAKHLKGIGESIIDIKTTFIHKIQ